MWKHAPQRLEVYKISVLQNTMLFQIAFLSSLFPREQSRVMKTLLVLDLIGVSVVRHRTQRVGAYGKTDGRTKSVL